MLEIQNVSKTITRNSDGVIVLPSASVESP